MSGAGLAGLFLVFLSGQVCVRAAASLSHPGHDAQQKARGVRESALGDVASPT